MGADEQELQPLVGKAPAFGFRHGDRLLDLVDEFGFRCLRHLCVARGFPKRAPRRRQQPGFGRGGNARHRPVFEGGAEGLGQRIFGGRDVARAGGEKGDQAAIALAGRLIRRAGSVFRRHSSICMTGRTSTEA